MIYNFQSGSVRGQPGGVKTESEKEREREWKRERVYAARTPATICQTNPPLALILCPLLSLRYLFSAKQLWCLAEAQWDSKAQKKRRTLQISCKKTPKTNEHKHEGAHFFFFEDGHHPCPLLSSWCFQYSYPPRIKGLIRCCCILAEMLSKAICSKRRG